MTTWVARAMAGAMAGAMTMVVASARLARAEPVAAPRGWIPDPPGADSLANKLGALPHFGGAHAIVTAEAYRAPPGSAALYVTRVIANVKPEDRDAGARAELDELHEAPLRQTTTKIGAWAVQTTVDGKQLEATLDWRDPSLEIANASRIVIAADTQMLVAVTGECVFAADAAPALVTACQAALATLDPGVAPASRVALAPGKPASAPTSLPIASTAPTMGVAQSDPPRLSDDGARPTLAPMSIPASRPEPDRRPVYVGAGLVVLAAMFWWNRRRRDRYDREDADADADAAKSAKPDEDADDLHAAAADPKAKEDKS
ncbi:MAG: hypothetical protein H6Q90_5323 [Deltaproteobacteria bacterium]|nr:hypothetical protein [Deltaproteobacteria bacterium]